MTDATALPPSTPTASPVAAAPRRVAVAAPWGLMWWKFPRHRLALWSGVTVLLI